ncbi:MAG TPA: SAM-dependent chlorinase/fluorinase, partial [Chloroflexota bacterium]|nr:SAM-dependent chlorinase/fluorinase [Chloroflexota bacterium]
MGAVITLLTDFGLQDAYAGVLKGVILGIAPQATVLDLCHEVPPQDVAAGAFLLMTAYAYFPAGTIHLAVVDPGVGTARKILAVQAGGYTFIGPDNGLLRWAVDHAGGPVAAVAVEQPAFRLPVVSDTFHGRDVMAPAAAHLARGVPLGALGPPVQTLHGEPFPQPVPGAGRLIGRVIYIDRFGNGVTNLPPLPGEVQLGELVLPRRRTYAEAAAGASPGGAPPPVVVLTGSAGYLELAVPGGSAAATLGLRPGTPVTLVT